MLFVSFQVRNPSSNLCLDTLGKDEKTVFDVGLFQCQGGASASEVNNSHVLNSKSCAKNKAFKFQIWWRFHNNYEITFLFINETNVVPPH